MIPAANKNVTAKCQKIMTLSFFLSDASYHASYLAGVAFIFSCMEPSDKQLWGYGAPNLVLIHYQIKCCSLAEQGGGLPVVYLAGPPSNTD